MPAGWLAGLRLGVIQFTIHILLLNLAGPPELVIIEEDAKAAKGDRDSEDGSEDGEEKDSDEVVDAKDAQDKDKLRALSCKRMPW